MLFIQWLFIYFINFLNYIEQIYLLSEMFNRIGLRQVFQINFENGLTVHLLHHSLFQSHWTLQKLHTQGFSNKVMCELNFAGFSGQPKSFLNSNNSSHSTSTATNSITPFFLCIFEYKNMLVILMFIVLSFQSFITLFIFFFFISFCSSVRSTEIWQPWAKYHISIRDGLSIP